MTMRKSHTFMILTFPFIYCFILFFNHRPFHLQITSLGFTREPQHALLSGNTLHFTIALFDQERCYECGLQK